VIDFESFLRSTRWRSVAAGALVALALLLVFGGVGLSLELTQLGPRPSAGGAFPHGVGRSIGGWAACSLMLAFILGGYLAARESAVRDPRHGVLCGALVFLLPSPLLLSVFAGALSAVSESLAGADPVILSNLLPELRDAMLLVFVGCLLGLTGSGVGGLIAASRPSTRA
jgi:hypothetical protein